MAQARTQAAEALARRWATDPRWQGIERTYTAEDVVRLSGSVREEHTLGRRGAERLWRQLHERDYVHALGALTGGQAVQQVRAGLQAIYLSGWQVAADANQAGHTYPDQSLYPVNSVPQVVRRINNALLRADQIAVSEDAGDRTDWLAPIVADAEAGFGGPLNAFELTKAMIAAGAAGIHYEDQLASEKKCGHLGGKVLVPTSQHIRTLNAARLAADIADVPTVVIARTDALAANLLTSDVDERDAEFVTGERTAEGFHRVRGGMAPVIARGLAYAPDALLVDGTGLDHPRRAGLALHLGAVLDLPTVGVTHRPLLAEGRWPADEHGARSPLLLDGAPVGFWLRTRPGTRPLAVHVAWRTDPGIAVQLVLGALAGHRAPEPLRRARRLAREARSAAV